jgi:hypothetical protein
MKNENSRRTADRLRGVTGGGPQRRCSWSRLATYRELKELRQYRVCIRELLLHDYHCDKSSVPAVRIPQLKLLLHNSDYSSCSVKYQLKRLI